jgi:hypothetical protein
MLGRCTGGWVKAGWVGWVFAVSLARSASATEHHGYFVSSFNGLLLLGYIRLVDCLLASTYF